MVKIWIEFNVYEVDYYIVFLKYGFIYKVLFVFGVIYIVFLCIFL